MTTVFHLTTSRQDTVNRALNNIGNMLASDAVRDRLAEDAGAEPVVCVATGPGVAVLKQGSSFSERVQRLAGQGATFEACENSIESAFVTADEMLDVVDTVPAGVVRIRDLQQDGAAYIRP